MGLSRQRIHYLSRNRRFLTRLALLILTLSFLCALSLSTWRRLQLLSASEAPAETLAATLEEALTSETATPDLVAWHLRHLHAVLFEAIRKSPESSAEELLADFNITLLEDLLVESPLDVSQRQLFVAYVHALFATGVERRDGREYLANHARMRPPLRFANEFLADLLAKDGQEETALRHYQVESEFPEADYARRRAVSLALKLEDKVFLAETLAQPEWRDAATPRQKIDIAVTLKDWQRLFGAVLAYDYQSKDLPQRLLTIFAASIWFVIVIQFGHYSRTRLFLYLAAILTGVASGTLTLYVLILQENVGGMNTGADWVEQALYFVVGVALREELIKLACFFPLLPFLLIRRNALEALLCAACVGLGFALQENVNYYQSGEGSAVALSRFLTANFFHLAATGLLGLALFEMILHPKRSWEEFLATFIGVVLLHGAYNSLLSIEELSDYSILYIFAFVLLAQRFFHKAGALQDARAHAVSPLAVFVLGCTLLVGVVLNYASWQQPDFYDALLLIGFALAGVFPIAFIFINQFKSD